MVSLILIFVLSYLVGSIPTSIIFSKLFRGIDIREHGSGNAGGTNAWRILGWKLGLSVMLIDIAKGIVATVLIAKIRVDQPAMSGDLIQIFAGLSAIIGHIWTVFAGFRGGKGVGTGAGMIIGIYPLAALVCLIVFGLTLFLSRIVSVSSMISAISLPITLAVLRFGLQRPVSDVMLYFGALIALLIVFTHRSNIKRLLKGEENKIGSKVKQ
ncbi:glycerol-3-phosphate 1-O-acyltransferase PlsY [candidate division KSB1 bacterium]|nr:glycerol-3-phosphate 1-O-acyltransferase PlsY [candidate division KSB1 bacterium]